MIAFFRLTLILGIAALFQNIYAKKSESRLDELIKNHIEKFKRAQGLDGVDVLVMIQYDFSDINLDGVKFIEPSLAGRYKLPKTFFFVRFTIQKDKLIGVNFKVRRKGKKRFYYTNLMNGAEYEL